MMEFRKRPAGDIWWNEAPITDVNAALSVLCKDGNSNVPTHLRRTLMGDELVWEIVMPWYRDGSSGNDSWGETYYDIDQAIAEQLVRESLVKPHMQVFMGGSMEDPDMLVIDGKAKTALFERDREQRTFARSLLTVGRHTDLTGAAKDAGSGREDNGTGRFYVDFTTPYDDVCRVYPDDGEVICPYPPPAAEAKQAAA